MISAHITIEAENAVDFVHQLETLVSCFRSAGAITAPDVLAVGDQRTNAGAGNGADAQPPATAEPSRRGRRAQSEAPAEEKPDRAKIIEELTEIFMKGEPKVRERITTWRDAQGVVRLRDLNDDAIPEAAKLLVELQAQP
jgi:hypothetical protein